MSRTGRPAGSGFRPTRWALRGGTRRPLVEGVGLSIDCSDEYTLVNANHLSRYRMLIIARGGIDWPYGHGNPTSNAGWWAQGQPEIVSDPPLPEIEARSVGWITPEQGQAVKKLVENDGTALFYHNVTNVALHSDDFRDVLGAAYQAPHLGAVESRVREGPEERCARAPGGGLSPAGGRSGSFPAAMPG